MSPISVQNNLDSWRLRENRLYCKPILVHEGLMVSIIGVLSVYRVIISPNENKWEN